MPDLTLIHYTSNHLDEHNPDFAQTVRDQIVKSAGEYPIISVSHKPMNFGTNICLGDIGRSHLNIYKAILIGAQSAKTEFVGMAEDDILYDASHWRTHRPPAFRFAYNLNRWGLNTWCNPPYFGYRSRIVINQMIAPTALLVEAFEERFRRWPDPETTPLPLFAEPGRMEKRLGVTVREFEGYASPVPSVVYSHELAYGYLSRGNRKSIGEFPRTELPVWGSAQKMLDLYRVPQYAEV